MLIKKDRDTRDLNCFVAAILDFKMAAIEKQRKPYLEFCLKYKHDFNVDLYVFMPRKSIKCIYLAVLMQERLFTQHIY